MVSLGGGSKTFDRIRLGLQLVVGIAGIVYGVAILTDLVGSPPVIFDFAFAGLLFVFGVLSLLHARDERG